MSVVNAIVGPVLDALLSPLSGLPAFVGLALVAAVSAVVMLLVVKVTSNQARLAETRRGIQACIYEIRLFGDDPRGIFRAVGELVRRHVTYLRLSLVPMLWLALPFGLLLGHLNSYYGLAGIAAERPTILKVTMKDGSGPAPRLTAPAGVVIETPAVAIPSLRETVWRISAAAPGDYELTISSGDVAVTKRLTTTEGIVRRSAARPSGALLDQLLHPSERPVPAGGPIESVSVGYPARNVRLLGWDVHWLIVFFVLTMVMAYALRSPLKVVI